MNAERRLSAYSADTTAPENPFNGECWCDATSGIEYRWSDLAGVWAEGGGVDDFPANPEIGDRHQRDTQFWEWNGTGWAYPRLKPTEDLISALADPNSAIDIDGGDF